ncbi:MAG TPA: PilZ domain-containing protein [Candidatus Dormibacteraeota bacterium]|nr:PilZ domain-containing protein [Candidatus Dormibacteraeota bacterium]
MGSLQEHFGTLPPAPDRRTEPRTTPASLTQVELGNDHSGIVLNISEAGMAIAVAHAFTVGEHLPRISFQLPGSSSVQSIEISAEIVWLSESKKGAGMQFVGLSADARNHISSWIARERTAPEFAHLPKPVRRDRQPLQISSGRSRTIFSREAVGNEEAGARYAKMFPSENANPRITATIAEIGNEEEPQPSKAAEGHVEDKIPGSPAEVSRLSIANTTPMLTATSAQEGGQRATPAPIQSADRSRREPLIPDKPETQAADSKIEISPSSADGAPSNLDLPEKSPEKGFKLQFAVLGFVLVAISFILGLTAGYAPIEKRLRSFGRPARPPAARPSAAPAVLGEATSHAPAGETFDAPPTEATSPDEEGSQPEIPPAPSRSRSSNSASHSASHSASRSAPPTPSSPPSTKAPIKNGSDSSLRTHELENAPSPESNSKKNTTPSETSAPARSKNPNPSPAIASKGSKPTAEAGPEPGERSDSATTPGESAARTAPPKSEPVAPPAAVGSTPEAPREPAARGATPPASPTPTPRPAPRPTPVPANVVIPPAENGKLVRAILPRKSIADSPELGITSQLSVLISPAERSTAGDHETARLQAGDVITYVVPNQPRPRDRYNSTETVRVRATIGSDGRVKDVRPINGPIFLLSSVISAVHQWRFHPTLLNGSPVQTQEDVTIEFRQKR